MNILYLHSIASIESALVLEIFGIDNTAMKNSSIPVSCSPKPWNLANEVLHVPWPVGLDFPMGQGFRLGSGPGVSI